MIYGSTALKQTISERALAGMRPIPKPLPAIVVAPEPASWMVIRAEPRREHVAEDWLKREGFRVYIPKQKVLVLPPKNRLSHRQRRMWLANGRWEQRPWLPGYLFVAGPGRVSARDLHNLTGVVGPIFFGEILATMSASAIQAVRRREQAETLDVYSFRTPFNFKVGESVRMSDGALAGHDAKVEWIEDNEEIVHLLTYVFGTERKATLHVSQIEKV